MINTLFNKDKNNIINVSYILVYYALDEDQTVFYHLLMQMLR